MKKGYWKLIQNLEDPSYELYNLQNDIGEAHDLATSMPDKVKELSKLLDQWRAQVGARFPVPDPDFDPEKEIRIGTYIPIAVKNGRNYFWA